ncbi:hypothetical protein CBR_g51478 [Chara braunii]|uniref:Reverse transcriptase domain-containing protein n=1 Tax=Chara braunii TaxID=69332 RepID=A0A388K6E6_CHABU|nr:hypothetical protein CBR_g51478 [Chara braunii]|eukprot:GBG65596.1 hypothetical protein CBR_g51478 [Chara braunii]
MTVQGRGVRFKVREFIDRINVQWLKERTVTIIFREAARFLARSVKEDLIRAYEDERLQTGQVNALLAQLLQELPQAGGHPLMQQPLFPQQSGIFRPPFNLDATAGFRPYQPVQGPGFQPMALAGGGGRITDQSVSTQLNQGGPGGASSRHLRGGEARQDPEASGGRLRGDTPGKHRRGESSGSDLLREESITSTPRSENSGEGETIIGTPGMKTTRRRTPTSLARGQLNIVEQKILPIMCTALRSSFWVIAWNGTDGVPELFSTPSPEQPMPTTVTQIVQMAVRGKFFVRLIPDEPMARFVLDLPDGRKLKFFAPILDARILEVQLMQLEQKGLRLLSMIWFAEGRRQELCRIRVPPFRSAKFLTQLDGKLARDKKFNSKFLREVLTKPWEPEPANASTVEVVKEESQPCSDHKPVVLQLHTSEAARGKGYFRFNVQNLEDSGLVEWMKTFWQEWSQMKQRYPTSEEWWQVGSVTFSNHLNIYSRILAAGRKNEERVLERKIADAERRMNGHPISQVPWGRERVKLIAEWDALQQRKSEYWAERLRVRGIAVYDRMNKESFQRLVSRQAAQPIVELAHPFDPQAPRAKDLANLSEYATLYYKDILTSRLQDRDVDVELYLSSSHWDNSLDRLPQSTRLLLDKTIRVEEALQTLKSMAHGKVPGDDGMPVELYLAIWEEIGDSLVEIYNSILTGGGLSKNMRNGVISVLYKKGDKADVRNYRPIALLNVSYKLLAKTLVR